MLTFINSFRRDESAATMVEYGLLVALIALVVGLGAQIVGTQLSTIFSEIGSYVGRPPATVWRRIRRVRDQLPGAGRTQTAKIEI